MTEKKAKANRPLADSVMLGYASRIIELALFRTMPYLCKKGLDGFKGYSWEDGMYLLAKRNNNLHNVSHNCGQVGRIQSTRVDGKAHTLAISVVGDGQGDGGEDGTQNSSSSSVGELDVL